MNENSPGLSWKWRRNSQEQEERRYEEMNEILTVLQSLHRQISWE